MDFLRPYTQQLLSLLRIMSGLLLLQHGTTKYLNFPVHPTMNNASPMTMGGFAGILELVGGVLLIIGLFTRPRRLRPVRHVRGGLFLRARWTRVLPARSTAASWRRCTAFVFLYLAAAGGGAWSVDRSRGAAD